jgi:hypothetical protein
VTVEHCSTEKEINKVMLEHELRLDRCETLPLLRRGKAPRRYPKTALISEWAAAAIARREAKL